MNVVFIWLFIVMVSLMNYTKNKKEKFILGKTGESLRRKAKGSKILLIMTASCSFYALRFTGQQCIFLFHRKVLQPFL